MLMPSIDLDCELDTGDLMPAGAAAKLSLLPHKTAGGSAKMRIAVQPTGSSFQSLSAVFIHFLERLGILDELQDDQGREHSP